MPASSNKESKVISLENYDIGMAANKLPFIIFVTNSRFEAKGGEFFKQITLEKEFYTSMMDGIYKGITSFVLKNARLDKHSHVTTQEATIFRYVMIFEDMQIKTNVELVEKRDGTEISENEKKLLKEQADKHKNG